MLTVKILLSALLVGGVSVVGRRWPALGGVAAATPFVSVLSLCFLYVETGDCRRASQFSVAAGAGAVASACALLALALLLRGGVRFSVALAVAAGALVLVNLLLSRCLARGF
jgi:hypothetical protein